MIEVLRAGLLTTVQDLGRQGHRAEGVPVGGALDQRALRLANLLVGNPPDAAGLELTLAGPRLHFRAETLVALAGAEMDAHLVGEPAPARRPLRVSAGGTLELGAARGGCRGYLACAGGIAVPAVLGSRSTCLLGGFGGAEGRALREGDRLPVGEPTPASQRLLAELSARGPSFAPWGLGRGLAPPPGADVEIRFVAASHTPLLDRTSGDRLALGRFRVGRDSNRMGCRLEGPELALTAPVELASEGVAVGTVQLPPGGAPIVLLADGGTTGGYPRIAHVATVDLPLLAQLRPGDSLRFREITLGEAHQLIRAAERELALLSDALRLRRVAPGPRYGPSDSARETR